MSATRSYPAGLAVDKMTDAALWRRLEGNLVKLQGDAWSPRPRDYQILARESSRIARELRMRGTQLRLI